MAAWSDLPLPIRQLIFQLLDQLVDRVRFATVCRYFRSLAIEDKPYLISSPFLLLPPPDTGDSPTRQLFSLADSTAYETYIPELQGKWCCGSSFGWLFTVDFNSLEVTLINPITRSQIPLPPLSKFSYPPEFDSLHIHDYYHLPKNSPLFILKATISSNPSTSHEFIVMTLITFLGTLAFYKPGMDEWINLPSIQDFQSEAECEDFRYYRGKFYVLTRKGAVFTWDLSDISQPICTTIIGHNYGTSYTRYLMESTRGELFQLCRIQRFDVEDDYFHETASFTVFKLDEEKREWVHRCLCGQAVFLGYNSAICVSTMENPEFDEYGIYFTDDNNIDLYSDNPNYGCNDVGCYDLNGGKVWRFYENHPFWTTPCIWVVPSLR